MPSSTVPIFTPDNEPYLGRPLLVLFDRTITKSMAVHRQLGARTSATDLTAIQIAAVEIIPQGISIALSMRELIRQAYLFSAGILMRPLIERTGMIYHLKDNPAAIDAWNNWHWACEGVRNFFCKAQHSTKEVFMPRNSKAAYEFTNRLCGTPAPRSGFAQPFCQADGLKAAAYLKR